MIRYYLICIFLCAVHSVNSQSAKGDSLVQRGDFLGARVAYERAIFEETDKNKLTELLLKKAACLKQQEKYAEAYEVIQRAPESDSAALHFNVLYESALMSYLNNKADLTLGHLQELDYYFPDTTLHVVDVLEIFALHDLERWTTAKEKFDQYNQNYSLNIDGSIYEKIIDYKKKKPSRAMTLSMLLPGSGQMYAGYFFRGVTSTLINTGLVIFTIYSFSHGFYWSGAFTGVGLFHLFYSGGANYARSLAEKKNAEIAREFRLRTNSLLLEKSIK